MPKRASWRLVKQHRSYQVDEVARLLSFSKGTVRRWIKNGLPIIGLKKPYLITGADLVAFLKAKSNTGQKCQLNECWCFTCRRPQKIAFGEVEITVSNSKIGMLQALCSTCSGLMFKRVSMAKIKEITAILSVTIKQADKPITDRTKLCLNNHLRKENQA